MMPRISKKMQSEVEQIGTDLRFFSYVAVYLHAIVQVSR